MQPAGLPGKAPQRPLPVVERKAGCEGQGFSRPCRPKMEQWERFAIHQVSEKQDSALTRSLRLWSSIFARSLALISIRSCISSSVCLSISSAFSQSASVFGRRS